MEWFSIKYSIRMIIYRSLNWGKDDWAKVLEVMYERQMTVDRDNPHGHNDIFDSNLLDGQIKHAKLFILTDLESEDVTESIGFLKKMDLIEEMGEGKASTYGLSYKGLQLAHQRKMERKQFYTNVVLTLLLVILSLISAFPILAQYVPF